jgi:hypothetical protein
VVRRSYRVNGTSFGVRTTSRRFGEWLDETFPAYRIASEEWPEYSVVPHDADEAQHHGGRRHFHVMYRGIGPLVRTFELATLGRTLLGEFESRLLEARTDAIFTYAALLSCQGVHVLAPSWLPPYLGRLGRKVERADVSMSLAAWIAVDPTDGRMIDPTSALDVPDGVIDRLAARDRSDGRRISLWPATDVHVDGVITYVEGLPGLELGARGGALYRLMGLTANMAALKGTAIPGLSRLVERARVYEVGLGRPQQMLDAVLAVAQHELAHR